ncbi:hypothetical protein KPATCC21470_1562 [Kitasatospora purpeofusca]
MRGLGLGIRDRSVNGLSPNFTVRPDRIGSMVNVSAGTDGEARGAGGGTSVFTRFPERSGPASRAEGADRGAEGVTERHRRAGGGLFVPGAGQGGAGHRPDLPEPARTLPDPTADSRPPRPVTAAAAG